LHHDLCALLVICIHVSQFHFMNDCFERVKEESVYIKRTNRNGIETEESEIDDNQKSTSLEDL